VSEVVVLDAAAFDILGTTGGKRLRAVLVQSVARGGEVRCAAVTLAEVCRGAARTRTVEAALARQFGGQRIRIVPTEERLAKVVGSILHQTGSGSDRLADAHVVAVCAQADVAVVITSDPNDIHELSAAIPATRVLVRRPSLDGQG
jgi:predicted nucleic acid-binding protein